MTCLNSTHKGHALNLRQRGKNEGNILQCYPLNPEPLPLRWAGLVRTTVMRSTSFPGQKRVPVLLLKGSHRPLRRARTEAQIVLLVARRGRAGWELSRGDGEPPSCLGACLPPHFMWGAFAWLNVNKGSLQLMVFRGVRSQTAGIGGTALGDSYNVAHLGTKAKHQEI